MNFPPTRISLIQRIAAEPTESDWRVFFHDYWGPIQRFSMRWGRLTPTEAEDVASQTLELLFRKRLLAQWGSQRTSKLRTFLCGVVRKILANRARVNAGRERILKSEEARQAIDDGALDGDPAIRDDDQFYAAWVDDLLTQTIERLVVALHSEGKGDYFRVLYGRVCEELTTLQIADQLGLSKTACENYYRAAKKRLKSELKAALEQHVRHYSHESVVEEECRLEWGKLREHLSGRGGLARVLHAAQDSMRGYDQETARKRASGSVAQWFRDGD